MRWLQQPRPTEHTQKIQFIKAKWPVQKRERNTLKVAIIDVYVFFIHVEFQQNIFKKFLVLKLSFGPQRAPGLCFLLKVLICRNILIPNHII